MEQKFRHTTVRQRSTLVTTGRTKQIDWRSTVSRGHASVNLFSSPVSSCLLLADERLLSGIGKLIRTAEDVLVIF